MTTTPHTIDDVLAWVREQHDFLVRQHFTLVDTGRMTRAEADRRRGLATATVACIEALKSCAPASIAPAEPSAPTGATGVPLEVNVRCGQYRYTRFVDAGRFLADAANRPPVMREVEARMMHAALNHATGGKAGDA